MPFINEISRQARDDGHQVVLPFVGNLQDKIMDVVRAFPMPGFTAEEMHYALNKAGQPCSLNCARSRMTELFQDGKLVVVGKRLNFAGTVRISVYSSPR